MASYDSFLVNQTLVLRISICGKNRQLLLAANLWGSVGSTKFNRFQLIKSKCYKINSIENQYFSYLSDSIFYKKVTK